MRPYVVKQGDYLTKLAHDLKFDADEVWAHEKNAALKELRTNPQILAPGDVLYVPKDPKPVLKPISKGTTNPYKATVPRVKVELRMCDENRKALAGATCWVHGLGGEPRKLEAGGSGEITVEVPVHVKRFEVVVETPRVVFEVEVGGMDPIDVNSGLASRLSQLGYLAADDHFVAAARELGLGDDELSDEDQEAWVAEGLVAFQLAKNDGQATGQLDAETRSAIEDEHGS
jgi:hypothetical protein